MEPTSVSKSNLPTIDLSLLNTHSEKSTSIQTIATTQLSSHEPNSASGSKKRKYDLRQIDPKDLHDGSVKQLAKRVKQNFSPSSNSQEEIQGNSSSSDKEPMEIDPCGEGSENEERKATLFREKIEKSQMVVNQKAQTVTIDVLPEEIFTWI
jgi:hypothetical protein